MKSKAEFRSWRRLLLAAVLLSFTSPLLAAAPVVSNVRAAQRAGSGRVDIYYDLASASNAPFVSVAVSTNGGVTFGVAASALTGHLGSGVTPGTGKLVVWNAGADLAALYFPNVRVRVTADDGNIAPPPAGMALIPAGSFTMGNTFAGEGNGWELPLRTVYVSAFYLDRYEVTKVLWDSVYQWATNRPVGLRYSFDNPGFWYNGVNFSKGQNHPVHIINWYDCVKWCNARSEQEGRVPAYYTDAGLTAVYRTGQVDVANSWVQWNGGYRLPTEAEWEKAARGGASGRRFPWSDTDTIQHSRANYNSSSSYVYDTSPTRGYHPTFATGSFPYTSPVGYFAANGYGLYDMAGNVWEWCWDWYGAYSAGSQTDPRGLGSGSIRVLRGGSWCRNAIGCRTAFRSFDYPASRSISMGFRSVLPPGQ